MYAEMRMKQTLDTPLADRLAVLGETVRLRMLRVLETQELSVGEVSKVVQLPQSTASRHLKALADAGWVVRRTDGPATPYRLVMDALDLPARGVWQAVREQAGSPGELAEDAQRLAAVLAERRTNSQGFFGRVAGEWDNVRGQLFGEQFMLPALLSLIPRHWVIADVGCGTGNAAELLAPHAEKVYAIDRSVPMLDAARRRLEGVTNVEFVEGVAGRWGVPDRSVDAAVAILLMHHVDEPGELFTQAARCLRTTRSGGRLLLVDMVEHDRQDYRHAMGHRWLGFSPAQIERWFNAAGFGDTEFHELPRNAESKGPGLFAAFGTLKD